MAGVESRFDLLDQPEAAKQESGRNNQKQRSGDLGSHEEVLKPAPAAAPPTCDLQARCSVAATAEKASDIDAISLNSTAEVGAWCIWSFSIRTRATITLSASRKPSGFRRRVWSTLTMAVLAPTLSATAATAVQSRVDSAASIATRTGGPERRSRTRASYLCEISSALADRGVATLTSLPGDSRSGVTDTR